MDVGTIGAPSDDEETASSPAQFRRPRILEPSHSSKPKKRKDREGEGVESRKEKHKKHKSVGIYTSHSSPQGSRSQGPTENANRVETNSRTTSGVGHNEEERSEHAKDKKKKHREHDSHDNKAAGANGREGGEKKKKKKHREHREHDGTGKSLPNGESNELQSKSDKAPDERRKEKKKKHKERHREGI
jgi:hypothetical protein